MGRDYLPRCRSIRVRDGKSCEMTRQRTSESFRIRLRFGVVPERDLLHHCRTAQASVKWTLIIAFGSTVRSQLEVNERICRTRLGRMGHLFEVGNLQIQRPFNGAGDDQPARLRERCRLRKGWHAKVGDRKCS